MTDTVATLREGLSKLNPRDQAFAQSLLAAKRPSDKQMHWIGVLAERTKGTVERTKVDIGSMTAIVNMFEHYRQHHVKLPRIILHTPRGLVAIHMAGEGSAFPGCIQVKEYDGDKRWFGRIYKDGKFELSPKYSGEQVEHATTALRNLAADPLVEATRSGKLTGRCCFCHIKLSDPRSTQMGYGPQCAGNFGLDWGKQKFAFAATPVEVVQATAHPDDVAMANAEAKTDREETIRDERRKSRRRIRMEGT